MKKKIISTIFRILLLLNMTQTRLSLGALEPLPAKLPEQLPSKQLASIDNLLHEQQENLKKQQKEKNNLTKELNQQKNNLTNLEKDLGQIPEEQKEIYITEIIGTTQLAIIKTEAQIKEANNAIAAINDFIENLKKDKNRLLHDYGDIIEIVRKHRTQPASPPLPVKQQVYRTNNDQIIVKPSLQQTIKMPGQKEEETTAYCGYYAIWNAYCFDKKLVDKVRIDRNAFCDLFEKMLLIIKNSRKKTEPQKLKSPDIDARYSWLLRDELRYLIQELRLTETVALELQMLFLPISFGWTFEKAFESQVYANLVRLFIDEKSNHLVVVLTTGLRNGHYLTIDAERNRNQSLILFVADSLPETAKNVDILEERTLPLYYMLKGWQERLDEVYAATLGINF